jgi:hypothetical protein
MFSDGWGDSMGSWVDNGETSYDDIGRFWEYFEEPDEDSLGHVTDGVPISICFIPAYETIRQRFILIFAWPVEGKRYAILAMLE